LLDEIDLLASPLVIIYTKPVNLLSHSVFLDKLINKVSFKKEALSKKSRDRLKKEDLNKNKTYNKHG